MKPLKRYGATLLLLAVFVLAGSPRAGATNGYRSIGHGSPSRSMGGIGTAAPQDGLAMYSNPAGIGVLGRRFDVAVEAFNPQREGRLEGTRVTSSKSWFAIPSLAYTQPVGKRFFLGIALVGSGGMNTKYRRNLYDRAMAASLAQAGLLPPGTTRLSHGDELTEDDRLHKTLRAVIGNFPVSTFVKMMPLGVSDALADAYRWLSARRRSRRKRKMLRPSAGAVRAEFESGIDLVVIGHWHEPAIETDAYSMPGKTFVMLGECTDVSASYAEISDGAIQLKRFPPA